MKKDRLFAFVICTALLCGSLTSCAFLKRIKREALTRRSTESAQTVTTTTSVAELKATETQRKTTKTQRKTTKRRSETTTTQAETTETEDVQEKEMRYAGRSSYPTVESIEVSFILSADKSYIYDICIEISHLKGKVVDGIKTTTVTVDKTKETYSDRRNIDYESVTEFIKLGPSELKNLYFEGETAFLTLDYTYVCNTIPGGGSMDFPFGTTTFVCEGQPVGDEFISAKEMRR